MEKNDWEEVSIQVEEYSGCSWSWELKAKGFYFSSNIRTIDEETKKNEHWDDLTKAVYDMLHRLMEEGKVRHFSILSDFLDVYVDKKLSYRQFVAVKNEILKALSSIMKLPNDIRVQ